MILPILQLLYNASVYQYILISGLRKRFDRDVSRWGKRYQVAVSNGLMGDDYTVMVLDSSGLRERRFTIESL
jgi:hypothetical protein